MQLGNVRSVQASAEFVPGSSSSSPPISRSPYSSQTVRSPVAQSSLAIDAKTSSPHLWQAIQDGVSNCLTETWLDQTVPVLGPKRRGKVRDVYETNDHLVIVTTDRMSAFDRVLASIPFKGQVLNQTSVWWFNNTKHITPNAFVSAPDPNVTVAKKCTVFPVEFVVRGYITGSTSTSLWTVYNSGIRNYCGNELPEGLKKNQRLDHHMLTPTTKSDEHDLPISGKEIVEQGLMSEEDFNDVANKALALFAYGQKVALEHGLLLVDTKYEFGKLADGTICLIDEVHTPDSSRYWLSASYQERTEKGLEPENIDKEFLRLWFKDNCNPYEDKVLPDAPIELVTELSWRYIRLYETITGEKMEVSKVEEDIHERITRSVTKLSLN